MSQPNTVGRPVEPQDPPRYGPPKPYRLYEELWCDGRRFKMVMTWHVTNYKYAMSIGPEYVLADDPADPDTYCPNAEFLYTTGAIVLQTMHRAANGKEQFLTKYGETLEQLAQAKDKLDRIGAIVAGGGGVA